MSDFFNRVKLASEYIQTPYAVFHSDDEFFLKASLCRAISLLDMDDELVACNGQVIGFCRSELQGNIDYVHGIYAFLGYAILEDNARDRLSHALATYNAATCYAVLRREVWISSWVNQAWSSPYAAEIYQAITTYLYGKLKIIDEIYALRSSENAPVSIPHEFDRKFSFKEWWFSPCFVTEREDFISQLAETAMKCSSLDDAEARKIVEDSVASYLACVEERKKRSLLRSIRSTTLTAIKIILHRIMPPNTLHALKRYLKKTTGENSQTVLIKNMREIQDIEKLILEFYAVQAQNKVMQ